MYESSKIQFEILFFVAVLSEWFGVFGIVVGFSIPIVITQVIIFRRSLLLVGIKFKDFYQKIAPFNLIPAIALATCLLTLKSLDVVIESLLDVFLASSALISISFFSREVPLLILFDGPILDRCKRLFENDFTA